MKIYSRRIKLIIKLLIACCFISATVGLDDYFNAAYFDKFNPPPADFNTNDDQVGFDSGGNNNPNALQFSGGASVSETPLYDNDGNQLVVDGVSVVTEADQVGYYDGYHNGKIHAGAIARININGTTRDCVYLNAVDIQNSGTFSGWVRVDQMSPSSTVWQYSQEINERRESVRYTVNSGGSSRYEQMEVTDQEVPSSLEGGYIIPNRTSSAGKVDYYYLRDGLINGFINLPETGNKRHGVQCSRVKPGASFWRDLDVDNYIQNIYGYNSSSVIGTFRWCYGYFITNAGTKIYCWANRDCLQSIDTGIGFVPDPNKTYYIDAPHHNLRLASTGASEDAYTTSTSTTGADVEWKFVDKGNGYWHIDRAAGGSKPRLRSDQTENADMQETSSSGTWTYYEFTEGAIANTYFLTLPDSNTNFRRLQINNSGVVKMVENTRNGTWESFSITEAVSPSGGDFQLVKRNATGFAIDGGGGAAPGRSLELYTYVQHNNLTWTEISRGGGYYSYQKYNTNVCMDGGTGGGDGQDVTLETCSANDQDQHWLKIDVGSGHYRLEKRGTNYSLDGGNGGQIDQNVYLWSSSTSNPNQQWRFDNVSSKQATEKKDLVESLQAFKVFPNPVNDELNIKFNSYDAKTTIQLYNVNGQKLLEANPSSEVKLDFSKLNTGIYVLMINNKSKNFTKKIIKL